MSKSISFAQTIEEIQYIQKKVKKKVIFLPLDLSAQLYCIDNDIEFYNPLNFVNNTFHKETLKCSKELLDNIKYDDIKFESHKKELKAFIRFRFHSIAFILEIINQLKLANKIEEIVLSGWDQYHDTYSSKNYFVTYIILNLIDDLKIITFNKIPHQVSSNALQYQYFFKNLNLDNKKKYILFTNLGYNFFKVVLSLKKTKQKILVPLFFKINFFKKIIYKILGVKFIYLTQIKMKQKKNINFPNLNFKYKDKDLSKVLNFRINEEKNNIINLLNKSIAIDNLFKKVKIKFVVTNITRGIFGYFVDVANRLRISSICIPHGTLAKNFNDYDIIYKKTISEAVTSNNATYNASQSNISKKFFELNKKEYNQVINTGNLIFSNKEKKIKKNKKILFAVTVKNFQSIQLLGVEMYFEFIDNLFFLENFSKKNNFKTLIKLHPGVYKDLITLKKMFPNLEFSTKNISEVFDDIFVTLSFSSTAIEDSLNSNCPVILLDRWKRYKHCDAEENVDNKNAAIYYVNNEIDLLKCINTINVSKKIDFSKFVTPGDNQENMNNLTNKYII